MKTLIKINIIRYIVIFVIFLAASMKINATNNNYNPTDSITVANTMIKTSVKTPKKIKGYDVYKSSNGKYYIIRKSKSTNKLYKQYLDSVIYNNL